MNMDIIGSKKPIWELTPELQRLGTHVLKYSCEGGSAQQGRDKKKRIWLRLDIVRLGARCDHIGTEILVEIERLYKESGYRGKLELQLTEKVIMDWTPSSISDQDLPALKRKLARARARQGRFDG